MTWVFADELSQDGIVKALDEGLTSVSDTGFPLELDVFDAKGGWLGMQGSSVSSEQVAWLRLKTAGFAADDSRRLKLFKIAAGHCDDTRLAGESLVPEPNLIEVLDLPISTGPVTHVQAFSLAPGDAIFAAILPEEPIALHLDIALTNACAHAEQAIQAIKIGASRRYRVLALSRGYFDLRNALPPLVHTGPVVSTTP